MKSLKNLIRWYFSKSALPYWSIVLLDCSFVVMAALLAFFVNRGSEELLELFVPLVWTLGVFLVCFLVTFKFFHTYDGVIRYSSLSDIIRVSQAVVTAILIIFLVQLFVGPREWWVRFELVEIIAVGVVVIVCMWLIRLIAKNVYEKFLHPDIRSRAFLLTAQEDRESLSKNLTSSILSPFKFVGLVSENPEEVRRRMYGMRMYPFTSELVDLMQIKGATNLIVAPAVMDLLRDNEPVVNTLIDGGIKIHVLSKTREWRGKEDFSLNDIQPVNVEDLLPRDRIMIDMEAALNLLHDKVVMITGAAGSIGSEMVNQIASYGTSKLILIDQAETPMHDIRLLLREKWPHIKAETLVASIADEVYMERIFKKYHPDYVFHAAAYKHVPMMEDNPYQSVSNNVKGTKILADLARKYGTKKFVMVSTDKAVNPTNVMGCSKRICEIYVQSMDRAIKDGRLDGETRFVTTRFGNVLGSNGSVIPIFQEQIRKGGPVTVTHPDIIRYFMLIPEACKLVIEAGTIGQGGEIYVFDMGQPVKIADLAQRMIRLSGARNVKIVFTGLRDGEKLYEELLNNEEHTLPTFHPKIKIAKVREQDYDEVSLQVQTLIDSLAVADDMEIVRMMKRIVPEFISKHSKYEALDN